jgi:hypothetical protein
MSTHLRNHKEQDDRKKGTLSNWPQLMRITLTALLGSWVLQQIKDLMSLGTNLMTHAFWQGYAEEPAGKGFVTRKAHAITSGEVQGIHWNMIKCKECLGIVQNLS